MKEGTRLGAARQRIAALQREKGSDWQRERMRHCWDVLGVLEIKAKLGPLSAEDRGRLDSLELDLTALEVQRKLDRKAYSLEGQLAAGRITRAAYDRIQRSLGTRRGAHGEERRVTGQGGDYGG